MLKELFGDYRKSSQGFDIFEIKATQTIQSSLFGQLDKFEENASPEPVNKSLVYGGTENQQRTKYRIVGWDKIS